MLRTYRRWEQAMEAPQASARAVLVNVCRERWRHRGRHPEISQDVDEFAERQAAAAQPRPAAGPAHRFGHADPAHPRRSRPGH